MISFLFMIEVWIAGLSELVVPPHGRNAFSGYVIKEDGELRDKGYKVIGKGKNLIKNVAVFTALIHALKAVKKLKLLVY